MLKYLELPTRGLPQGVTACSSLTELVLEGIRVSSVDQPESDESDMYNGPYPLSELPAAGPFVNKLVRLSLFNNAFSTVPPILAAATALEHLDLARQQLTLYGDERPPRLQGLAVLDKLPRLHGMRLTGFRCQMLASASSVRRTPICVSRFDSRQHHAPDGDRSQSVLTS